MNDIIILCYTVQRERDIRSGAVWLIADLVII